MHELTRIAADLADAAARGETAVLATVVRVVGSAYRGVGARLVVRESGETLGLVSGGCLEGDLAARATAVRASGRATVVTYDTRSGDDLVWGLGLGCEGLVEVLLEALPPTRAATTAALLRDAVEREAPSVLATAVVSGEVARLLVRHDDVWHDGDWRDAALVAAVSADALDLLRAAGGSARGTVRDYESADGTSVRIALEPIAPPVSLVLCGAGPDAAPVARLALTMGWEVTVVDHRPASGVHSARFPDVRAVHCPEPARLADVTPLGANACAVVMSHHFERDLHYLHALLESDVRYIGLLGPRSRAERMLAERRARLSPGGMSEDSRLHAPVGLDLGGDGPEAVALAVIAEVLAVTSGREGGKLRARGAAIHVEMRAASCELRE
jgi:xanthine dehydrogenase accessory factor